MSLRSRSAVGFVVMLTASVFSSGCGGSGSTSDVAEVEAQTTQLDLTAESGRIGGDGQAVGRLGQHCSPSGSHACVGHDQKGQLVCGASGRWQANGTCSASNECDTTPGPSAGSCRPVMARCRQDDDEDGLLWHGHGREWKGRPPRICDYERCVDERHHERWHRVCKDACTPGAAQCSGNGVRTCDASGRWNAAVPCVNQACDAVTGACTGVCAPGATQCSGNGVQTCDASGQWGAAVACVNQACDGATAACTGVCMPGAAQCSGNGVQTCDASGQWGVSVACVNQACDVATGTCTGLCSPGAAQCLGNGVETCDASGQWGASVACVNQACDGATGACTGVCTPGAALCSPMGTQTCDASGQWGAPEPCVNQPCDVATGTCTGLCMPGATQCSGNGVQTCDPSGRWGAAVACVNQACDLVTGKCLSIPAFPACLHASYEIPYSGQSCTQSQEVPGTGCGPAEPPVCYPASGTERVVLSFDEGWRVSFSGFGSATYPLLSSSSVIWHAETGPTSEPWAGFTVDCGGGTASLFMSQPGSRISMCTFELGEFTSGQVVCNAATCGACVPGATRCSGDGVQTCDASMNWGAAMTCAYSCDAATGTCGT